MHGANLENNDYVAIMWLRVFTATEAIQYSYNYIVQHCCSYQVDVSQFSLTGNLNYYTYRLQHMVIWSQYRKVHR